MGSSGLDLDFKTQIRIQLVLVDPDPEPDPDPDPMDRARNSECFTFLTFENPSRGSKVISLQSLVLLSKNPKQIGRFHLLNKGNKRKLTKFKKKFNFFGKKMEPV